MGKSTVFTAPQVKNKIKLENKKTFEQNQLDNKVNLLRNIQNG